MVLKSEVSTALILNRSMVRRIFSLNNQMFCWIQAISYGIYILCHFWILLLSFANLLICMYMKYNKRWHYGCQVYTWEALWMPSLYLRNIFLSGDPAKRRRNSTVKKLMHTAWKLYLSSMTKILLCDFAKRTGTNNETMNDAQLLKAIRYCYVTLQKKNIGKQWNRREPQ